jgi:hypothetical protein
MDEDQDTLIALIATLVTFKTLLMESFVRLMFGALFLDSLDYMRACGKHCVLVK